MGARAGACAAALAAALAAFLPFARGALDGSCFYFRDLARQFFPLRLFALEGLKRGELWDWNPLLHEGIPLSLPALSYPLDLLQLLRPDEAGISLTLALHGPLGALAFFALARGLALDRVAAAGGAALYALGGFYLSTLNLYVYVQAAAWAPIVVLGLIRAAQRGWRSAALAAIALAVQLSTTGAEIVAQTVGFGIVLALSRPLAPRLLRLAVTVALGAALAAPTVLRMSAMVEGSAREAGFATSVALGHSIHPLTLPQLVIAHWHGDLGAIPNRWWGSNFFPQGFPYLLSFYLGACALGAALVGALHGREPRGRLIGLAALGLLISVGRWAGLALLVDLHPLLRTFRFPSKAFFSVHLAVALLAAIGIDRLCAGGARRPWATLSAWGTAAGGALVGLSALPSVFPGPSRWFLAGFLPPVYDWPRRAAVAERILADAAQGGLLAIVAASLALAVLARRLSPRPAAAMLAALLAGDLLRAGAGLNPMVSAAFLRPSREAAGLAAELRAAGGRLYSCNLESVAAYFRARALHPTHDLWTLALLQETLTPALNMRLRVPTALSQDLTMLVPTARVLDPEEMGSARFDAIVERLRAAGVSRVACIAPIAHGSLRPVSLLQPARIAPLAVHVYALQGALPLRSVEGAAGRVLSERAAPDRLELEVEAEAEATLLVRDAFASGWSATVDGAPARVRSIGEHRAVGIPPGRSSVVFVYRAPGARAGLLAAGLALAVVLALAKRG